MQISGITAEMFNVKPLEELSEILTDEEYIAFKQPGQTVRDHPVSLLLTREGGKTQHAVNVKRALKQVSIVDLKWIERMKPRIVGSDAIEAASALAELRAYGALLEAGFGVAPIPVASKPTPEFRITAGNDEALVEVHAKQFYTETQKEWEAHQKWIWEQDAKPGVSVYTHVVHPFGRPDPSKPGDSTATNAISRICAIKQKEHQLSNDLPSILWLDFQDLYSWDMGMSSEQFRPILSWNEHLTSGALWYALYGWKGAPVFDSCHYSHLALTSQWKRMAHMGRYLQSTKLSAVVASFPNTTILAESPRKGRQLPDEIRWRYLGMPWAKIEYAIAEWTEGLVAQTVRSNAALICALAGEAPPAGYPEEFHIKSSA